MKKEKNSPRADRAIHQARARMSAHLRHAGADPRHPGEHRAGVHAGTSSEGLGLSEARLWSQGREEVEPRVGISPRAGVATPGGPTKGLPSPATIYAARQ